MAEREQIRVEHFGQDLQRLDQTRTGAVEILIAVGNEDLVGLDSA